MKEMMLIIKRFKVKKGCSFTGFLLAACQLCQLKVNRAMTSAITPAKVIIQILLATV